jgi:dUTP pyrophosphatase
LAIPLGYYGRIAPRSGLAKKFGIDVLGGVVDSPYRGEIGIILINTGNTIFEYKAGDAIAQLIIEVCKDLSIIEADNLSDSVRGTGGFGSTGSRN